ncbi:MAG: hypothetical protein ABR865_07835 [Terracidiphilus sp.]|jgi:hypothetical protein
MPKRIGRAEFEVSDLEVRALLKGVMANCPKSREQIAEELTVRLRRKTPITKDMLDDQVGCSEGKARAKFPAAWVAAFCEITGNDELQRLLLSPRQNALLALGECELAAQLSKEKLVDGARGASGKSSR